MEDNKKKLTEYTRSLVKDSFIKFDDQDRALQIIHLVLLKKEELENSK